MRRKIHTLLKKTDGIICLRAEGGTGERTQNSLFHRSRTLMGIYEPCPHNPIMRQILPLMRRSSAVVTVSQSRHKMVTGIGDICAGRMIDQKYSMLGRETALDPITWTPDGWPIVNHLHTPGCQQKKPLPEILYYSKDKRYRI